MFHRISLANKRTPLIPPSRFDKKGWTEGPSAYKVRRENYSQLPLVKKKMPVKLVQPNKNLSINWENALPKSSTSEFGPHYWYMLHTMALNYPNDTTDFIKEKMKCFVEALPYLLPCKDCSEHAKEFLFNHRNDLQSALSSKESLFKFLWFFHNHVNDRLGKPQISLQKAFDMYKA